ncbi:MAG: tRNA 2-thiouridine(34) synthase MnmA [Candidatus Gracilibacteria bacterium]
MSPKQSLRDVSGQAGGSRKSRVLMAMSGGVDSSVAALLLKKKGLEVIGVFMHFWAETHPGAPSYASSFAEASSVAKAMEDESEDEKALEDKPRHPSPEGNKCCSLASFNDARRVANILDIPLYTVNFDRPFKKLVVDSFLAGYQAGETPNPCVECNRHIKFELLLKKADELGADFIATGHYAKVALRGGKYSLRRPKDADKDQTYFLYTLDQKKLKRIFFPLADLTKPQVRALAKKASLAVAGKAESQEICFIPGKSHNDFLKRHLKLKPGPIRLLTSPLDTNPPRRSAPPLQGGELEILGKHQGLPLYTIGQRKGVEIGGSGPFYVARCDYKTNTLYVVTDHENKLLYKKEMTVREVNWISSLPKFPMKAKAVIRYRHLPVDCVIYPVRDSDKILAQSKNRQNKNLAISKNSDIISNGVMNIGKGELKVKFAKAQRAVTPGQSVVFYKGTEVLGGGIINS